MEDRGYKVKTAFFEGPLDLLLNLIEKRKLMINDISLASVADDYVAYVQKLGEFPLGESANFILIASTLVLIKSKSLLPVLELTEEETGSIQDLERRLILYKRMRDLSLHIKNRFGVRVIYPFAERVQQPVFSPAQNITLGEIASAIKNILKNLPKKEFIPKAIIEKVMSLEEMISHLTERVNKSLKLSFKEFAKMGKESRVHVIVSFLAMLELVKQGVVNVVQERHFGDIDIETENVGVPKYNI